MNGLMKRARYVGNADVVNQMAILLADDAVDHPEVLDPDSSVGATRRGTILRNAKFTDSEITVNFERAFADAVKRRNAMPEPQPKPTVERELADITAGLHAAHVNAASAVSEDAKVLDEQVEEIKKIVESGLAAAAKQRESQRTAVEAACKESEEAVRAALAKLLERNAAHKLLADKHIAKIREDGKSALEYIRQVDERLAAKTAAILAAGEETTGEKHDAPNAQSA